MARITGHLTTQAERPCGRLVPIQPDYDAGEKVLEFTVPSLSRGNRVYVVEVDALSGEVACPCEALKDYREASRMPYNREVGGVYLEQLARVKGYKLLPIITRPARALCPHARKVQAWLKRNGHFHYFKQLEERLIERAEAMPKRGAA